MSLALLSARRVSEITNIRVDYLTKNLSTPTWRFTIFHVATNSLYVRQMIPVLQGIMFWGLDKTNFLLALLSHINVGFHQQSLQGWESVWMVT